MTITNKICLTCGVEKALTEFHKKKSNKTTGVDARCKLCKNAACRRDYNEYKRARNKDYNKRRHADNPTHKMFARARNRAKTLRIPFNLTIEDIVIPEICPVLGIPIKVGEKIFNDYSPSLDRLIPENGYTRTNVVVMASESD